MNTFHLLLLQVMAVVFMAQESWAAESSKVQQSDAAEKFFEVVDKSEKSSQLFERMNQIDREIYEKLSRSSITCEEAYAEKFEQIRKRFSDRDNGGPVVEIRVEPMDVATLLLLGSLSELPSDNEIDRKVSIKLFRGEIAEVL